jgi:hypothetical protein
LAPGGPGGVAAQPNGSPAAPKPQNPMLMNI